ncbi:hypothetical protein [Bacillus sp. UNC322MFChir4.1]|uniref:hypothetical protein n=1 Tax=Bacillus sp. UNC322MFChir4.1 TaxID=1449045 RepID=UPI0005572D3D|nr:hypothetical protein [Bacillus sp. UNC322MFChir4.1]
MNQMINTISLTGDWELDIQRLLEQYNKPHTYEHSVRVANEAKRIAKRFELDEEALELSLEHASFAYISFLWEQKESLKVIHSWLQDAYFDLKENLGVE